MPGTVLVVAEFEAMIDDPALLVAGDIARSACRTVQAAIGFPRFLAERTVREALPQAAEKPRCGSFEAAQPGQAVGVAEVFLIAEDVGQSGAFRAPDRGPGFAVQIAVARAEVALCASLETACSSTPANSAMPMASSGMPPPSLPGLPIGYFQAGRVD